MTDSELQRYDFLQTELQDACIGEGNRTTFIKWCRAMAKNDRGILQNAAKEYLQFRNQIVRKKPR